MSLVTENNAIGAVDGVWASGSTTLTLQSMTGMPVLNNIDEFCILTIIRTSDNAIEYVKCTAQNIPARTYTVIRGQEDSLPLDFADGDEVRNLWSKGQISYVDYNESVDLIKKDGSVAFTGDVDMGGNVVTNGADAVNPTDLVTKQQAEAIADALTVTAGTVLTTIDMTNGGANDLNNIDITWQASWDTYDYCELVIDTAESSSSGNIAWALSANGGSTWKSFAGLTRQAITWTNQSFGAGTKFSAWARMNIKGHQKWISCNHFSGGNNLTATASNNASLGYGYVYSGGTLTSLATQGDFSAWDTGSDGLNTYMLRFVHEVGNFTSGTLKIIGYNYP